MRKPARLLALASLVLLAACGDDGGASGGPDPTLCAPGPVAVGTLTTYAADAGGSACQPSVLPDFYVAVSDARFDAAGACGACLEITGSRGTAVARVVDRCPSCGADALDGAPALWTVVADGPIGIASVTWRTVACAEGGPIRYLSCEGTNPFYLCLVAEDHRFPLASLEVRPAGAAEFVALARDGANQWTHGFTSAAAGPFTVRATDTFGHVLVDTFANLDAGTTAPGAADFPATCP